MERLCCRSTTLSGFTDTPQDIAQAAKALLRALSVPHERIRGIGLTVGALQQPLPLQLSSPALADQGQAALCTHDTLLTMCHSRMRHPLPAPSMHRHAARLQP